MNKLVVLFVCFCVCALIALAEPLHSLAQMPKNSEKNNGPNYKTQRIPKKSYIAINTELDLATQIAQKQFAQSYLQFDILPKERVEYYQYVNFISETQKKSDDPSKLIGWRCFIENAEERTDGWRFTMTVIPLFNHGGTTISGAGEPYKETYRFTKGKLTFIRASKPMTKPANRIVVW